VGSGIFSSHDYQAEISRLMELVHAAAQKGSL